MNPRILVPATLLLAGCSDITGIWLFEIPYQEDSLNCSTSVAENFIQGYVPQGDAPVGSDWVYNEEYTGSDAVSFGQIETYGDGSAVLVVGTAVYPGVEEGGVWTFTWSDSEETLYTEEHYDATTVDYGFQRIDGFVSTSTFTFEMTDKNTATVGTEATSTSTTTWFEVDRWTEEMAFEIGYVGQIPSDEYLVYDEGGGTFSQDNDYDVQDCDSSSGVCELAVEVTCSDDGEFTAHKTDFEDEDHFRSMRESGQGGGA